MHKLGWMALALLAVPGIASAQDNKPRTYIMGPGTVSCGKRMASLKDTQYGWVRTDIQDAWVLGFLSALDMALPGDTLTGTDTQAVVAAVNQHCTANPLGTVYEAAIAVWDQLRARER